MVAVPACRHTIVTFAEYVGIWHWGRDRRERTTLIARPIIILYMFPNICWFLILNFGINCIDLIPVLSHCAPKWFMRRNKSREG